MKKNHFPLLVLMFICPALLFAQSLSVTNNSKKERKDAIVSIPWKQVTVKFGKLTPGDFKVVDQATKQELHYQAEYLGEKEIQNLLIQLSIAEKSTAVLGIEKGKQTPVAPKTFARFVPERLDDFAWENDKIAFRAYGKALEGRKDNAYGLDVWVKRTTDLIIDRRYKHGDYHHDLGDGMDYYHVGLTLGAGNIAPILDNQIIYSQNYHRYKVLDNGPLRTTFALEYDAWMVGNTSVTATKKISIDAGSQMNKIEVTFDYAGIDSLPVVIGIIKRPEAGNIMLDEAEGITSYWEPQHGTDGTTGVAIILTTPVKGTTITKDQILTHTIHKKGTPIVYYMGAAWDKAEEITDASKWNTYVKNFKSQTNSALKVKVN